MDIVGRDLAPGEARSPGISVQDVLIADGDIERQPSCYREQSYTFIGDEDLPYERYTSAEFLKREFETMWPRTWQWACREEHIPEAGDYHVYDVGPYSLIVIRGEDDAIRAFHNACLHRGTKLKNSGSAGYSPAIACPFHGWSWNLEGKLCNLPAPWDFPHVDKAAFSLPEVKVGLWGGFVFVNMDPDAPPLEEYLAPLPEHARTAGMEDRYIALHVQKELPCNWKTAMEAFMESYHLMATHPQLGVGSSDTNTQYDIYTDHVSRLFAIAAVTGAEVKDVISQQQIIDSIALGDRAEHGDKLKVPEGESARRVLADYFKSQILGDSGIDMESRSISEIIDTLQYFVFPNGFFFLAVSFPIIYRFRPMGMDPNQCLFDLIVMPPVPASGERPLPAEPFRLTAEQSYTLAPGVDETLGIIFDQDTGNLAAQQLGFVASIKDGATLANYQEARIRHMHATLDKYLALPPARKLRV